MSGDREHRHHAFKRSLLHYGLASTPTKFEVRTEPFSEFTMDLSTATLQDHQVASPCLALQERSCTGKDLSHSPHTQENTMSSTVDQGAKSTLRGSL